MSAVDIRIVRGCEDGPPTHFYFGPDQKRRVVPAKFLHGYSSVGGDNASAQAEIIENGEAGGGNEDQQAGNGVFEQ